MSWICPDCNKEFKHSHQWHSCARVDVAQHLKNKSSGVQETFDKLMREVGKFGELTLNPVKTCIQVKRSATFLSIKLKKEHVEIEFQSRDELKKFPVYKSQRVSRNRVVNFAIIEEPADVDKQLLGWLKASYDLVG